MSKTLKLTIMSLKAECCFEESKVSGEVHVLEH